MAEEVRQFNENLVFQEEQKQLDRQHQSAEAVLDRKFKEEQAKLDRQHDKDMLAAQTKAEKEKIEKEYAEKKKYLAEQLEQEKALLKYEYDLKKQNSGTISKPSGGSGSKSSGGSSGTVTKSSSGSVSKTTGSAPKNNMASILALGYGPISASKLAQLMSSGQVKRTLENGQYYYSKNTASPSYNRLKNMGLSN